MSLLMSSIVILGGGSGVGSGVGAAAGVVGTGAGSVDAGFGSGGGGADITSLVGSSGTLGVVVMIGTLTGLALRALGLTDFGLSSAVSIKFS
jgi:hypothetical protein